MIMRITRHATPEIGQTADVEPPAPYVDPISQNETPFEPIPLVLAPAADGASVIAVWRAQPQ